MTYATCVPHVSTYKPAKMNGNKDLGRALTCQFDSDLRVLLPIRQPLLYGQPGSSKSRVKVPVQDFQSAPLHNPGKLITQRPAASYESTRECDDRWLIDPWS